MKTRIFLSLMLVICYVLSGIANTNIKPNYANKMDLRNADISTKNTLSKTSYLLLSIDNQLNDKSNRLSRLTYAKELFSEAKSFFVDEKIVYAEYFIDKDPGFGKGTSLPITASTSISNHNFTVALPATVSEGFHFITIRYKDALERWSVSVARPFYKDKIEQSSSTLSNIVYAEYFIDKDPGFGKGSSIATTSGTEITNHTFAVVLPTSLEDGFHFVTVRYKDALGRWGVSSVRPFYKDKVTQGTVSSSIVYAEYFIDKDPGFGKGSSITMTSGTEIANHTFTVILPTTLEDGFHFVTVRYKDALGRWGVSSVRPFYKDKTTQGTSLSTIVYAEYFIDKDPGFGKGKSLTVKGGQTIENLNFDVNLNALGLSLGKHFIQLRAKDANGVWGTVGTKTFVLTNEIVKMTTLPIASCTLKKIDIPYVVEGVFGSNNVFSAELSDIDGVFQESPIQLGSITSTKSGTIKVDLPADLTGNNYKIRIVSTNPVRISDPKSLILKPTLPTVSVSNNLICQGASTILSATGCSGTVTWTGNLIGSSITVSPTKNSNYKALCIVNDCKSDSSLATIITILPKPAQPKITASNSSICSGSSSVLTATACTGGTLTWTGGLTGNSITVSPTVSKTYKVLCTIGGCKSDSSLATIITILPKPAQPKITASNSSICSGSSSVLTATACTGGTLTWTGGLTGNSITVSPTVSKTYKVLCTIGGCKSDSSLVTTITVTPKPTQPKITASNTSICVGSSSVLTATACTGGTLTWTGGLTGNSITVSPTSTRSYKVLCTIGGCKSDSSLAITVTVVPKPTQPKITASNSNICVGSSSVLTSTACTGGTLTWTGGLTGNSITVSPTVTKSYKVLCTIGSCKSDSSLATTITVTPKPTQPKITASNSNICAGSSSVLTATACTGGTLTCTGGLTGNSITVSPTSTRSYKVLCTVNGCKSDSSLATTITVIPKPTQPKITANNASICVGSSSVLTSTACTGGTLTWTGGLTGSSITVSPTSTRSYKVLCTIGSCKSDSSLATTITVTPKPTQPKITANNSNICVGSSSVLTATACTGGTLTWTDGLTGNSIAVSPTKTSTYKVLCTIVGCKSDSSMATTVTVVPKPTQPKITASNTSICAGGSSVLTSTACTGGTLTWTGGLTGSSITVSPTSTRSYKVLCTIGSCKSDSSLATTITVTPKPTQPKITASNTNICVGSSSVLTSTACTGGTLTWTGGLTGNSITVSPTVSKTYKVLCTIGGCKSDSSFATTITVVPKPTPPTISSKTNNTSSNDILTQWDKTLGGNNYEQMSSIVSTRDGGFILGGSSYSDISGDKTQVGKGSYDYWIIKSDANGNKIWDKTLGGSNTDYKPVILSTNDGGYIIGGTASSNISGDKTEASRGNYDYWVIKIDANGNKIWDKTLGGNEMEELSSIISSSDGGFLLAGYSYSGISGDKTQANKGEDDYWVVKIDANGNKVWDKAFGGSNYDELFSVVNTGDGGYLLGGYSKSGISGDKTHANKGGNDYWIIKIDANGNKIWDKTLGGNSYEELYSMVSTSDGGFILAGNSITDISGDKTQVSNKGSDDYWIVKVDANGNKIWDKTFGGNSADYYLTSVVSTNDGSFLLGGRSNSDISGDKSQASKGLYDYWIVKIDANGNKIWDKTFGGSNNDYLTSVVSTNDGSFLLGGRSNSDISGDKTQASKGDFDYWLVKIKENKTTTTTTLTATGCTGTVTWSNGATGNSITVSPTVANTYTAICTVNGCVSSASNIVTITIPVKPATPTITTNNQTICSGFNATLLASTCSNGTLAWTGGLTGSSITVSPAITKSYKVVCIQDGVSSDSSLATTITVIPKPLQPKITTSNTTICVGGSSVLTTSACTGGTSTWTGGLTGTSITVSPTATKNYKVVCKINGCTSDSSLATTITIVPKPNAPIITSNKCTNPIVSQWNKTIKGDADDWLYAAIPTSDGGYLLGGISKSGISNDKSEANRGDYDYWIIKLNANGAKVWDKTFGGTKEEVLQSIVPTQDGGFVIAGYSISDISGDKTNAPKGGWDFWLVKIDSKGNKIWDKSLGGGLTEIQRDIVATNDGGFIVAGFSYSDIGGDKSEKSKGGADYWVIKINSNGAKVWDKTFGGNADDNLKSIIATSDGGFILGGYSNSNLGLDKTVQPKGGWDYWLLKINANGIKVWDKSFGGNFDDVLDSVVPTSDGGFLIGGTSQTGINGDKSEASKGYFDYWIIKTDANGVKVWDKTLGSDKNDYVQGIVTTKDGGYLIGGSSYSGKGGDKSEESKGDWDQWIVKINSNGNKIWDKTLGGSKYDELRSIIANNNDEFVLAGYSESDVSGDKSETSLNGDFWITKIKQVCDPNNLSSTQKPILTESGCTGTVTWSNNVSGNTITVNPTIATTYTATCTVNGCVSQPSNMITVTIPAKPTTPTVTTATTNICSGTSTTLTASVCTNGTLTWTGGLTGSSIVVSPISTKSYRVVCTQNGVSSDSSLATTITVISKPTQPKITTNNSNICVGSSSVLTATACTGGTLTWTGGLTGNSIAVSPTKTSTYKVLCTIVGCKSDSSMATTVTVVPKPTQPKITVSNTSICVGSSSVLTSTACTGGTLIWTGGLTGSTITVSPTSTRSYKALCTINGCKSDSSLATTITVTPKPAQPKITASNSSICSGSSSVLTATACTGGTLTWTGGLTGSSITVSPTATKAYKVLCTIGGCKSDSSLATMITVIPKPSQPKITASNATICAGSSSVLTATACTGGTLTWTGGLTGNSITVSPTVTKAYKALCTVNGCKSDSSLATTVTVTPKPTQPKITVSNSSICSGSSSVLTSTACTGGTLTWTGGLTGNSITVSPTKTRAYKVLCTIGGCKSDSSLAITITVIPKPNAPLIMSNVVCNNPVLVQWNKTLGGNLFENLHSIVPTKDGGYLLGGNSSSGISGNKSVANKGETDFWIVKINANGTKAWDKTYGGSGSEELASIIATSDGGFLLGGSSYSGISGDKSEASKGNYDCWVLKINANGSKLWDKTFGGGNNDFLYSMIETSDGYLLGGTLTSKGSGGDISSSILGSSDYWLIKVNSSGVKIWDKTFGGNGNENLNEILMTSDGGFLLGGSSSSGISGNKSEDTRGLDDFWVVKINSNGEKVWDKTFGGSGYDNLSSMVMGKDGSFLLGGGSSSGANGDKSQWMKGYGDYWIIKVTADGTKVWDKTFGGSFDDNLNNILTTSDNGYLLGGNSGSGISGDRTDNSKGSNDYWVIKINAEGSKLWDKAFGGNYNDNQSVMISTSDGGFIVGGSSISGISGDKSETSQGTTFDYWILKASICNPNTSPINHKTMLVTSSGCTGTVTWSNGSTGNSITVSPSTATTYTATCTVNSCVSSASNAIKVSPDLTTTSTSSMYEAARLDVNPSKSDSRIEFKVFPNPAKEELNVETDLEGEATIQLYNILGQQVLEKTFVKQIKISLDGFSKGAYYYLIQYQDYRKTGKVLME